MAVRSREHGQRGADVGLTSGVRNLEGFVVHAHVVRRDVEHAGLRREARRLLVLRTESRRADALRVEVGTVLRGRVLVDDVRTAVVRLGRIHLDARRPVHDRIILLGDEKLTGVTVEGVGKTVTIEVHGGFPLLALHIDVGEDDLVDAVVVPLVERGHLIDPLGDAGVDVTTPEGHRPLVVAGTLSRVPGRGVARAVVHQVDFRVVRIPAPGATAADLPLVALPGLDRAVLADRLAERHGLLGIDQNLVVGADRVTAPHLLAGVHVVRGDVALHAELAARNTDDDLVLDRQNGRGVGLALLRIAVDGLPDFLAGLRVESDNRRVSLMQEDLAVGVSEAAVHRIAAHHRDNRRVLLGLVLPDDPALVVEVQSVDDVRERGVDPHRVADNDGRTLVAAQDARREGPSDLQVLDVVLVDLIQLRITLIEVIAGLKDPVVGVTDQFRDAFVRQDRRAENSRRQQCTC